MRVLMISGAFPPVKAGEADHALHLGRHLAERGLEVHVLTNEGNYSTETLFKVHPIMPGWSWRNVPRLGKFLRECAPDAIIMLYSGWVYGNHHPMMTFAPTISKKVLPQVCFVTQFESEYGAFMDWASLRTRSIRKGVKHLVGIDETDYEFGTLLRDSDTVIVLSDDYQRKFSDHLPRVREKTVLLPPPPIMHLSPNHEEARRHGRQSLNVAADEFLLAYFGYVHEHKGIDVLLEALSEVSRRREDVKLVIIGGTEDDNSPGKGSYAKEMARLSERLGVSEKVIWTGKYPSDSDYASVCLRSADAGVLPYDYGVTLNRSSFAACAAHGLPTITTKGDTLAPQFVNRENALLCAPRDAAGLAAAIEELMCDEGLRRRLSAGSAAMAEEWFSWDKAVARTIAAFEGRALVVN